MNHGNGLKVRTSLAQSSEWYWRHIAFTHLVSPATFAPTYSFLSVFLFVFFSLMFKSSSQNIDVTKKICTTLHPKFTTLNTLFYSWPLLIANSLTKYAIEQGFFTKIHGRKIIFQKINIFVTSTDDRRLCVLGFDCQAFFDSSKSYVHYGRGFRCGSRASNLVRCQIF